VPLSLYDQLFSKSGKRGSAAETLAAMKRTYGAKKGTSVFYASVNQRKKRRSKRPAP
jgi:hypothetical protein